MEHKIIHRSDVSGAMECPVRMLPLIERLAIGPVPTRGSREPVKQIYKDKEAANCGGPIACRRPLSR
jgi:hypothetical protein